MSIAKADYKKSSQFLSRDTERSEVEEDSEDKDSPLRLHILPIPGFEAIENHTLLGIF